MRENKIDEVDSTHVLEQLPIKLAACGCSTNESTKSPPSINFMPRSDGLTDVVICRLAGNQAEEDKSEIERLKVIVELLKSNPREGIEQLIRTTDQVFLDPGDYGNDSIISPGDRAALGESIARYRAERFLATSSATSIRFGKRL